MVASHLPNFWCVLLSKWYQPCTNHVPTMYQPCTNHVPTMYQPCTNHVPDNMSYPHPFQRRQLDCPPCISTVVSRPLPWQRRWKFLTPKLPQPFVDPDVSWERTGKHRFHPIQVAELKNCPYFFQKSWVSFEDFQKSWHVFELQVPFYFWVLLKRAF